jgi:hypothetical protein
MKGVFTIPLAAHTDERGALVAPQTSVLPFHVNNYFSISGVPPGEVRANHSSCSDEALMVVQGGLTVDLDNGIEKASFVLKPAQCVLCVHAGVHLRLHGFEPGTILFVLASKPYTRGSRHDHPQPDLLGGSWEVED